jgi:hypothetical protein
MFEKFEEWFKTTEAFKTITQGKDVEPFCREAWIACAKSYEMQMNKVVEDKWKELSYAAAEYKKLEKKYKEATEELEFYANTDNWLEEVNRNNIYTVIKDDASDDYDDCLRFGGKRARAFLFKKNDL